MQGFRVLLKVVVLIGLALLLRARKTIWWLSCIGGARAVIPILVMRTLSWEW